MQLSEMQFLYDKFRIPKLLTNSSIMTNEIQTQEQKASLLFSFVLKAMLECLTNPHNFYLLLIAKNNAKKLEKMLFNLCCGIIDF